MEHTDFLSDCCNAPYRSVGEGDFSANDRAMTMHAECTKCGKDCNLHANVLHPDHYPSMHPKSGEIKALKAECESKFKLALDARAGARIAYEMAMGTDDAVKRATHLKEMGVQIEDCITTLKVIAEALLELEQIACEPLI